MVLNRDVVDNLGSSKARQRLQALSILRVDREQTIQLALSDPKAYLALLRALLRCIEREKQDYLEKTRKGPTGPTSRVKLENDALQLTRFGEELRAMVEQTIDIVGKQTREVVAHILNIVQVRDGLFQPLAYPYMKLLSRMICSAVRYQIAQDHIHNIIELCQRLLMPPSNSLSSMEIADGGDNNSYGSGMAVASTLAERKLSEEEAELCTIFSRALLCLSRSLQAQFDDFAPFYLQFFKSGPIASIQVAHILSSLNHLLLQTANDIPDRVHPFLTIIMRYLVPYWHTKIASMKRETAFFFRIALRITLGSASLKVQTPGMSADLVPIVEALYDCVTEDILKLGQGWAYIPAVAVTLCTQDNLTSNLWSYLQPKVLYLTTESILHKASSTAWMILDVMAEICAHKQPLDMTTSPETEEENTNSNTSTEDRNKRLITQIERRDKRTKRSKPKSLFADLREILLYPLLTVSRDTHIARCIGLQLLCALLAKYSTIVFNLTGLAELSHMMHELLLSDHIEVVSWAAITSIFILKAIINTEMTTITIDDSVRDIWLKICQLALRKVSSSTSTRFLFALLHTAIEHPTLFLDKRQFLMHLPQITKLLDPASCPPCASALRFCLCVLSQFRSRLPTEQDIASWKMSLQILFDGNGAINFFTQCAVDDEWVHVALNFAIVGDFDLAYTLSMQPKPKSIQTVAFHDDYVCELQFDTFKRGISFLNGRLLSEMTFSTESIVPEILAPTKHTAEILSVDKALRVLDRVHAVVSVYLLSRDGDSGDNSLGARPKKPLQTSKEKEIGLVIGVRMINVVLLTIEKLCRPGVIEVSRINYHPLTTTFDSLVRLVEETFQHSLHDLSYVFVDCLLSVLVPLGEDTAGDEYYPHPVGIFRHRDKKKAKKKPCRTVYQAYLTIHDIWWRLLGTITDFSSAYTSKLISAAVKGNNFTTKAFDDNMRSIVHRNNGMTSSVIMQYHYPSQTASFTEINIHMLSGRLACYFLHLHNIETTTTLRLSQNSACSSVLQAILSSILLCSPLAFELSMAIAHIADNANFTIQLLDALFELLADSGVKNVPFTSMCALYLMSHATSSLSMTLASEVDVTGDLQELYRFCAHRLNAGPAVPEYHLIFAEFCFSLLVHFSSALSVSPSVKGQGVFGDVITIDGLRDHILQLLVNADMRVCLSARWVVSDLLTWTEQQYPMKLRKMYQTAVAPAVTLSDEATERIRKHHLIWLVFFTTVTMRHVGLRVNALSAIIFGFQACGMNHNVIQQLYTIARAFQYTDTCSFIKAHIRSILYDWIPQATTVEDFPFQLCGWESYDMFLGDIVTDLVPLACLHERVPILSTVSQHLCISPAELLCEHLATTLACLLPLYYTYHDEDGEQAHRIMSQLRVEVGETRFATDYPQAAREVFCHCLLLTADDNEHPWHALQRIATEDSNMSPLMERYRLMCVDVTEVTRKLVYPTPFKPHYSTGTVLKTLAFLTSQTEASQTIPSLDEQQCVIILPEIFEQLSASQHPRIASKWIHIYRLVLTLMSPKTLATPFVSRFVTMTLVHLANDLTLCDDVIPMARFAIESLFTYKQIPTQQQVDIVLPLIAMLTHCLQTTIDTYNPHLWSQMMSILSLIMQKLVQIDAAKTDISAADAMLKIPPFPHNKVFNTLKTMRDEIHQKFGIKDTFESLAYTLREGKSAAACMGVIQTAAHLVASLQESNTLGEHHERIITTFMHELITILRHDHEPPAGDLVTELSLCLAELAPFINPDKLRLHAAHHDNAKETAPRNKVYSAMHEGLRCILRQVIEGVFNEQASVACEAIRCLPRLLSSLSASKIDSSMCYPHSIYVVSFRSCLTSRTKRRTIKIEQPVTKELPDLRLKIGQSYAQWIRHICVAFIRHTRVPFLRDLESLIQVDTLLAETAFPYVVYTLLTAKNGGKMRARLSAAFSSFFRYSQEQSFDAKHLSIRIILLMRREALRLRINESQAASHSTPVVSSSSLLDIDYLNASDTALACGSFSAALLFLEIWHDEQKQDQLSQSGNSAMSGDNSNSASYLHVGSETGTRFQALSLKVLTEIGEPDGFYGAPQSTSPTTALERYQHEGEWLNALEAHEMALSTQPGPGRLASLEPLAQDLIMLGHDRLLLYALSAVPAESVLQTPSLAEAQFTALARNAVWDIDVSRINNLQLGAAGNFYMSLSKYNGGELEQAQRYLRNIDGIIINKLSSTRFARSPANVQRLVIDARTSKIADAILFNQPQFTTVEQSQDFARYHDFRRQLLIGNFGFEQLANSLTLEAATLDTLHSALMRKKSEAALPLCDVLESTIYQIARQARKATSLHIASHLLRTLRGLTSTTTAVGSNKSTSIDWNYACGVEEAKIMWKSNQRQPAITKIKSLINSIHNAQKNPDTHQVTALLPVVLKIAGRWIAETRLEHPDRVMHDYLERAVAAGGTSRQLASAYHTLAKFADEQYMTCLTDEHVQRLATMRAQKQEEIKQFRALARKDGQDGQKLDEHIRRLEMQLELDQRDHHQHEERQQRLVEHAMQSYVQALSLSAKFDLSVFRLCSLWFENEHSSPVNEHMRKACMRVPLHKFLLMTSQLAARLGHGGTDDAFQAVLMQLLKRVATQHPHHTLYQLIALAHGAVQGYKDKTYRLAEPDSESQRKRIQLSTQLLQMVQTQPALSTMVTQYLSLSEAYIELSYHQVDPKDRHAKSKHVEGVMMPSRMQVLQLTALQHVPVTTLSISIDPSGQYNDIVSVRKFGKAFRLVGGVNLPKVLECEGSDGCHYTQLVKGNDDLRQDATLMQVFGVVNMLLQRHANTRKRGLKIRTYKVIPLAPKAGLLEWVGNTLPIGNVLLELHPRYNPTELTSQKCREVMAREFQNPASTAKSKSHTYQNEVTPRFRPVFRHWFWETFPDPEIWYQRRLTYTRSCASTSILGYVVGLGDRHAQNILVDLSTAELIHIDLGISFDAGKILPVPELVPFRLTRDLVDGMGMSGVEGVYRRCCQETLQMLRDEYKVIYTILEVFKYDPLHNWTIDPSKLLKYHEARQEQVTSVVGNVTPTTVKTKTIIPIATTNINTTSLQSTDLNDGNKEAQRALAGVSKKLTEPVSVACQVNELIQTATNPELLSCMFPGWQAWL